MEIAGSIKFSRIKRMLSVLFRIAWDVI